MSNVPGASSEVEPKPWQTGLAPVYIGMFLWVAFFDQLGRRALPVGGLGWSLLGAAAAGPLCYLLLFRVPATWGRRTGMPLSIVSTATFGVKGSALVPGLLLGLGQLVFFAVAIGYAVDLTMQGLLVGRLIDPRSLRPIQFGGATLKAPLYLLTALFWGLATALVSLRFVRWIAFLMQFFPIFPAVMLGGAMLAMLSGLRSFHPSGIDPMTMRLVPVAEGNLRAFVQTLQWVFAFATMAGLVGADWGAGSLSERDVRLGGWVGIGLAPVIVASLALIAVAGHQGSVDAAKIFQPTPLARSTIQDLVPVGGVPDAPAYTFRALLAGGFDRRVGCMMLLTFGLASLAPGCYASFIFGQRFEAIGPGISRGAWTILGTTTAWLLIVGGWADRTETVFHALGAVFAPVAGAMAADSWRRRGQWPGPRRGINPAGMIAWFAGMTVGLAPLIARASGSSRLERLQPAAVWAFVVAALVYTLLSILKLESGAATMEEAIAAAPRPPHQL